jgi:competence protein ComEC
MFDQTSPALAVLSQAIAQAGVPLETLSAGNALVSGPCTAHVLHPPASGINGSGIDGSDNARSLVLSVEHAGRRVLLTGDLEPPGVQRLFAEQPLDCDVLLAPHHGSHRSQPERMIVWSTPEWAVISTAHSAAYSPTAYEPLLGPRALNTADAGAVRISLSADRVDVRAWRIDPWD